LIAIGVDGAPAGWIAACLYTAGGRRAGATRLALFPDIAAVARFRTEAGGRAAVAVDVPIGLLDSAGLRPCDRAARRRLPGRASSVFAPPARYMLAAAGDYGAIRALVAERRRREPAARSLSAQAAGIAAKVAEVDAFARADPAAEGWLWECHPELSLAALNGGAPVAAGKRSAAGRAQRLALARAAFPDAGAQVGAMPWRRREVAVADALDAYAALSTALRCARGEQEELGDGGRDGAGVLMRIAL
jgi:predicted RNase H-like nuclease